MMKRLLYLGYYAKELDRVKFRKFINHVSTYDRIPKWKLFADMITSSLRYNISFNEYFLFHFYKSDHKLRSTYAGTGFMYEYQLAMNPKSKRHVLEDKLAFLREFKDFVIHDYASLVDMRHDTSIAARLLANPSGKVVLKGSDGQCGRGIEVRESKDFTPESLIERLQEIGNDFVEEFVMQHHDLNRLSSSGLNTVRIVTQLNDRDEADIIGARLRITVNSPVDNMAAGNIAAPIDPETGVVIGGGVYSDITKPIEEVHPVTGVPIVGFHVPFWKEAAEMVRRAALIEKGNRSVGWDVAITSRGPELIEGNHDWCKLLWQLPVQKGLKNILQQYQKTAPNT